MLAVLVTPASAWIFDALQGRSVAGLLPSATSQYSPCEISMFGAVG
jgi:hypothetical protein